MEEVGLLKKVMLNKEELEAEMEILKSEVINLNHSNQQLAVQNHHLKTQLEAKEVEMARYSKERKTSPVEPLTNSLDKYTFQKENDRLVR